MLRRNGSAANRAFKWRYSMSASRPSKYKLCSPIPLSLPQSPLDIILSLSLCPPTLPCYILNCKKSIQSIGFDQRTQQSVTSSVCVWIYLSVCLHVCLFCVCEAVNEVITMLSRTLTHNSMPSRALIGAGVLHVRLDFPACHCNNGVMKGHHFVCLHQSIMMPPIWLLT